MSAPPWIQQSIAEYGRQLGIDHLSLGEGGLELALADGGVLRVNRFHQTTRDEVLVHLTRPFGHRAGLMVRQALTKAHFAQGGPWPVQLAMRGSGADAGATVLIRIPERSLTPQVLSHAVEHLSRWMDELEQGPR